MVRRKIITEGKLAYIPLTRGYTAVIDASDVHLVEKHDWYARVDANIVYAGFTDRSGERQRTVLLHRFLMEPADKQHVDHIDHNGLNNRRTNLRCCTASENQWNSRKSVRNKSGFKGVTFDKTTGKWKAAIRMHNVLEHLGLFETKESAYEAYCKASQKYRGEFGWTGGA